MARAKTVAADEVLLGRISRVVAGAKSVNEGMRELIALGRAAMPQHRAWSTAQGIEWAADAKKFGAQLKAVLGGKKVGKGHTGVVVWVDPLNLGGNGDLHVGVSKGFDPKKTGDDFGWAGDYASVGDVVSKGVGKVFDGIEEDEGEAVTLVFGLGYPALALKLALEGMGAKAALGGASARRFIVSYMWSHQLLVVADVTAEGVKAVVDGRFPGPVGEVVAKKEEGRASVNPLDAKAVLKVVPRTEADWWLRGLAHAMGTKAEPVLLYTAAERLIEAGRTEEARPLVEALGKLAEKLEKAGADEEEGNGEYHGRQPAARAAGLAGYLYRRMGVAEPKGLAGIVERFVKGQTYQAYKDAAPRDAIEWANGYADGLTRYGGLESRVPWAVWRVAVPVARAVAMKDGAGVKKQIAALEKAIAGGMGDRAGDAWKIVGPVLVGAYGVVGEVKKAVEVDKKWGKLVEDQDERVEGLLRAGAGEYGRGVAKAVVKKWMELLADPEEVNKQNGAEGVMKLCTVLRRNGEGELARKIAGEEAALLLSKVKVHGPLIRCAVNGMGAATVVENGGDVGVARELAKAALADVKKLSSSMEREMGWSVVINALAKVKDWAGAHEGVKKLPSRGTKRLVLATLYLEQGEVGETVKVADGGASGEERAMVCKACAEQVGGMSGA